jgi:hypothetical protein
VIGYGVKEPTPHKAKKEGQRCTVCQHLVALDHRREHLIAHNAGAADMTAEEVIDMYTEEE